MLAKSFLLNWFNCLAAIGSASLVLRICILKPVDPNLRSFLTFYKTFLHRCSLIPKSVVFVCKYIFFSHILKYQGLRTFHQNCMKKIVYCVYSQLNLKLSAINYTELGRISNDSTVNKCLFVIMRIEYSYKYSIFQTRKLLF